MKNVRRRFAILCILVLLTGVTALAVNERVSNFRRQDANVEVETFTSDSGDPMFRITRQNAENGKLYTVFIRSGAESDNPSAGPDGNLVYMDVMRGTENGVASLYDVYPMEMTPGTYRVYMSDYQMGAVKEVATFEVSGPNPSDVKPGFVVDQNNTDITGNDVLYALYISVGKNVNGQEWSDVQIAAANVDGDDEVTGNDVLWILERSVGKRDANWNRVG